MGTLLTAIVQGAVIGGGVGFVASGGDFNAALKGAAFGAVGGGFASWAGGAAGGASGGAAGSVGASQVAGFSAAELAGWGGATAADMAAVGGVTSAGMFAGQTAGFTSEELAGWGGAAEGGTAAAAAGGANDWLSTARNFIKDNKGLITTAGGVYGMTTAAQMQEQALLAQKQANMWANSGGQGLGVQQLQQLMQDPEQLAMSDPAYRLRVRAAQRATAGYGQNSGAMAVAGANASTDWYNQRMAQLAGVSGANVNPAAGQQVAVQQQQAGNNLMGQSLATMAYGLGRKDWWNQP